MAVDTVLGVIEYALVPLELAFLGYVAWRTWRAYGLYRSSRARHADRDAVDAIRATAAEIVRVPAVARVLSYELSVLYLAIRGWRLRPHHDESRHFTCYRDSSYGILLAALMIVLVLETAGVHVALHVWVGPAAAWIATGLSLYATVWILGDYHALRLRPIAVEADRLRLRVGLRWEAEIPFSDIRAVRRLDASGDSTVAGEPGASGRPGLKMTVLGPPGVRLDLAREVRVFGFYGIPRRASRLLLSVDAPERFCAAVAAGLDRARRDA